MRRARLRRAHGCARSGRRSFWRGTIRISYFAGLGDLIVTGPTNTNVMDVRVILVGEQRAGLEHFAAGLEACPTLA